MPDPKIEQLLLERMMKDSSSHEDAAFRQWYSTVAQQQGLDSNPDAPEHFYDYRAAHEAGAAPDDSGHWPSTFKKEGHPQLYVDGQDTRTGEPIPKPMASHMAQPADPMAALSKATSVGPGFLSQMTNRAEGLGPAGVTGPRIGPPPPEVAGVGLDPSGAGPMKAIIPLTSAFRFPGVRAGIVKKLEQTAGALHHNPDEMKRAKGFIERYPRISGYLQHLSTGAQGERANITNSAMLPYATRLSPGGGSMIPTELKAAGSLPSEAALTNFQVKLGGIESALRLPGLHPAKTMRPPAISRAPITPVAPRPGLVEPPQRTGKSLFDSGNALLQRFGTKSEPSIQELERLVSQGSQLRNLSPLEQQVFTQLKGRLAMMVRGPIKKAG